MLLAMYYCLSTSVCIVASHTGTQWVRRLLSVLQYLCACRRVCRFANSQASCFPGLMPLDPKAKSIFPCLQLALCHRLVLD